MWHLNCIGGVLSLLSLILTFLVIECTILIWHVDVNIANIVIKIQSKCQICLFSEEWVLITYHHIYYVCCKEFSKRGVMSVCMRVCARVCVSLLWCCLILPSVICSNICLFDIAHRGCVNKDSAVEWPVLHQLFRAFITSSHSFMREGLTGMEEGEDRKYTVDLFWWQRTERHVVWWSGKGRLFKWQIKVYSSLP